MKRLIETILYALLAMSIIACIVLAVMYLVSKIDSLGLIITLGSFNLLILLAIYLIGDNK